MKHLVSVRRSASLLAALLGFAATNPATAQDTKGRLDVYGFAMLDMGYQAGQNDPAWFDVVRPTKLPAFKDEYGHDGRFFMGVRQSRLGLKGFFPTAVGEVKTIFEFELFGTGPDAGETTFRLRHAWGELGKFGAGQYWSVFVDPDAFPNTFEYWGPNGLAWYRNVQARWTPVQEGPNLLMFALERPGAAADQGNYQDRIELQGVSGRFPLPDVTAQYKRTGKAGHLAIAGLVRQINWDDMNGDQYDLTGSAVGYGVNISTNLKVKQDVLRASLVYGAGIQNYMNDAPTDVGIESNPGNARTPIVGKALPLLGVTAFYDRTWNSKWTSSIGGSLLDITNSDGQSPDAFRRGSYGVVNLLSTPTPGVTYGAELQYGRRDNNSDGFSSDDVRIQFSFKYNFKHSMGGN